MVVVTGIGLIAPHGDDPAAVFDAVMRGAEKKAKVARLDGGALPPKRVN